MRAVTACNFQNKLDLMHHFEVMHRFGADCSLPDIGDDLNSGLAPFSAEWKAAVQDRVDAFVVSLPLGTTPYDAEIEEKVAERLYDDEIAAAAVKSRLSEWCALESGADHGAERVLAQASTRGADPHLT